LIFAEIYEIRIYENAPPGTKATFNEGFDRVLRELKNCFAQLDSDVDWIEFDSPLLIFLTTKEVPAATTAMQYATLHLMCASNMVEFRLNVNLKLLCYFRFDQSLSLFMLHVGIGKSSKIKGKLLDICGFRLISYIQT
jgi:hypothetical protein